MSDVGPEAISAGVEGPAEGERVASSRLTVVVPTFRRPAELARCLDALGEQDDPPDEVVVVRRRDDRQAAEVLDGRRGSVREVVVDQPGLLASLGAGAAAATGTLVAFTDDDARPRPDWCGRIRRHLADPSVGAVGGRDLLTVDGEPRRWRARTVGVLRPWGRVVGNHEGGVGGARAVDHLKGVNLAVRSDLLRLPLGLRGQGAQVYNELALCLGVQDLGYEVRYDPDLLVDHHWAERHDDDRRHGPSMQARANAAFNQSYIVFSMRPRRRWARLAYVLVVGDRGNGGAIRCGVARLTGDTELRGVFVPFARAHLEAWRVARREPLRLVAPRAVEASR